MTETETETETGRDSLSGSPAMSPLVSIALLGWIPVVLGLFAIWPPRRAAVAATVVAWLFLPIASFPLPGLPDYTKTSATTAGILLGSLLFDPGRLISLRPRWFDLPILVWCLTPVGSSLLNDLGLYDGVSASVAQTIEWGLPYLIGRAYFSDREGLDELTRGIVLGGLVYVPFCLYEIRMSPQFHRMVYGYHQHSFGQSIRFGGFRPTVFMSHGLEVGMWMSIAALLACWLGAAGTLERVGGVPLGLVGLPLLLITALLCKSSGALVLLATGLAVLGICQRTGGRLLAILLLLAPPLYMASRSSGVWSGRNLVELVASAFDEDRAQSLEFRFENEDMLVTKALQRPLFGWGGWGRARVYDADGRDVSVTDGLWIIAIGNHGIVGLASLSAVFLLPCARFLRNYPPRVWRDPGVAPAAALSMLLCLSMIDHLANAMRNPVYLLAAGGLSGLSLGRRNPGDDQPSDPECSVLAFRIEEAETLAAQARALAQSDPVAAEHAWSESAARWHELMTEFADRPEYHARWCATLNDLAWFLSNDAPASARDPNRAVQLAEAAVAGEPEEPRFWNTLGAAYYRAGTWDPAIAALERSIALCARESGVSELFLAQIHARRGESDRARACLLRAQTWLAEHPEHAAELDAYQVEAQELLPRAGQS